MPRIIAVICVRMGSERLPGKPMREIAGRPLIAHLLDRVKKVDRLDGIVVATPQGSKNDAIAELCSKESVACFRGSEDDVTERILGALTEQQAKVGVEIYGDGPLIDPACIDECLDEFLKGPFDSAQGDTYDLVGNDMKATYPSGMYNEVFSIGAFRDSTERCFDPATREHGTLFLRQHPDLYRIKNIEAKGKLRRPDIHLDVDTEEDIQVIATIVEHFASRTDFTLAEIIAFLDAHPHLRELNRNVHRRWKKYMRS